MIRLIRNNFRIFSSRYLAYKKGWLHETYRKIRFYEKDKTGIFTLNNTSVDVLQILTLELADGILKPHG
jgi:hypothetical protein